jgi:hypothetical protein
VIKSFLAGLLFLVFFNCTATELSWRNEGKSGFSASATFSKDTLSLLDHLRVELTLTYPETYHPNIGEIRIHLFQNIGMDAAPFAPESDQASVPNKLKEGVLAQTLTFLLVPQRTGTHALTFFDIPFEPNESSGGNQVIVMSGIAMIKVTSPLGLSNSTNYEPPLMTLSPSFPIDLTPSNKVQLALKTEQEAKRNLTLLNEKTIPWLAIGLLILASFFAILFIKTKETISKPFIEKIISPKAKAVNELKKIKHQDGPQLYLSLTNILSQFVEEQYKIPTRTRSSKEFLAEITLLPLSPQIQESLKKFINTADQIKFGLLEVSSDQSQNDFEFIQKFISNA